MGNRQGNSRFEPFIPLSECLHISVQELLKGERQTKVNPETEQELKNIIVYDQTQKKQHQSTWFFVFLSFLMAVLLELGYLKGEFNPSVELPYLLRLALTIGSCLCIILGSKLITTKLLTSKIEIQIWNRFTLQLIFVLYLILLFNMVLFSRFQTIRGVNLIPFRTILDLLTGSYPISYKAINLLGNFLVFIPIPYFLSTIWSPSKKSTFFLTMFFLILIELFQYWFHCGVCDIDDILLAGLGCGLFLLLRKPNKNDP